MFLSPVGSIAPYRKVANMVNIGDLTVGSGAFSFGDPIPVRHTMLGDDVNPEVSWTGLPQGTAELAIICDDPDAPLLAPFVHWVVFGISPAVSSIDEATTAPGQLGRNDFGNHAYNGPRPPAGHGPHHYYFWVFALESRINSHPDMTGAELRSAMEGLVIEQNRLVGTFERHP